MISLVSTFSAIIRIRVVLGEAAYSTMLLVNYSVPLRI